MSPDRMRLQLIQDDDEEQTQSKPNKNMLRVLQENLKDQFVEIKVGIKFNMIKNEESPSLGSPRNRYNDSSSLMSIVESVAKSVSQKSDNDQCENMMLESSSEFSNARKSNREIDMKIAKDFSLYMDYTKQLSQTFDDNETPRHLFKKLDKHKNKCVEYTNYEDIDKVVLFKDKKER